jgi:hypothetical protein
MQRLYQKLARAYLINIDTTWVTLFATSCVLVERFSDDKFMLASSDTETTYEQRWWVWPWDIEDLRCLAILNLRVVQNVGGSPSMAWS